MGNECVEERFNVFSAGAFEEPVSDRGEPAAGLHIRIRPGTQISKIWIAARSSDSTLHRP